MLDSYGRNIKYLRLSVTELCNLRCRYCMPENGVVKKRHDEILTEEEMICAVRAAASVGIEKVRITGGEPLLKPNIISICSNIAKIPGINELCLTTNGNFLPEKSEALKHSGVKRINISLDTLSHKKYEWITRNGSLEKALEGIEAAVNAGFEKVKINTVLIKGFNDDEIISLANLTYKYPVDVRFIELMPMNDNLFFERKNFLSCFEVLQKFPDIVKISVDGVAELFHLKNALGNIGLISTVSKNFCSECSRLRLTADGKIKPCLHTSEEINIKGMNEYEIKEAFIKAVSSKPERRPEFFSGMMKNGRTMNQIGG